ncbi:nucleotidyltransferase substrate binding protein [Lonepinella koalarum]|uniref:Nucleotidyltransferase substrate binding protein (TIGR01987 family) n=1 Tax=Lonepinella koalarum TaxID=53417 RepID=A0A4R1KW94_9PAST|nr:nucleotidyltransferase substrate binding protein [Lonepinella koalarum]MDH2926588.1 nucleotidyltransferase [Lonepinella koalarum]TCK69475.1 nucleotidyltransferase substrate binding protein (TIGR01987 family) [Lonepinella koalarum]TFJ89722.1 nucleotidyltransferase [Lonepinella koalarum]
MVEQITRLKQRFEHYQKALTQLMEAVEKYSNTQENIIKEGLIQRFEFTHELAWKLMKDILQYEGDFEGGSRTTTRQAFNLGYISQGEIWMEMIKTRNLTVHTYNEDILEDEFNKIISQYFPLLVEFKQKVETLCQNLD